MKTHVTPFRKFKLLSLIVISLVFLLPIDLLADHNNGGNNHKDIIILVSCVEDIGNGKIRVHFGYENPNETEVNVNKRKSKIYYNKWKSRKYAINKFQPGIVEKAFYQDINSKDRVRWTVTLPNGKVKTVDANINSNHCSGSYEDLDIIPGYNPPEGGKVMDSKIGAELTSLHQAYIFDPANFEGATDAIFQLDGTKVFIEVVAEGGQYATMISDLSSVRFELLAEDPGLDRATGWVEIADLLLLNEIIPLHYARPVYPGVSNYIVPATGLTKSQGDFAMHSDFARLGFDLDGSGVKIGVLSNSYNTRGQAGLDVSNGDLPGADNPNGYTLEVDVIKDVAGSYGTLSDEGRAMLQIVHDIAPGAELAFRTGYLGERDMAVGIRQLADVGSDIIVDDLSYITEPFFRDGVISKTIDSVVNEGITFFSSAGNFGKASYTGVFDSEPTPSTITGTAHDFSGSGDIYQGVLLREGSYTLVLQWDDGSDPDMRTTTTDLDLFLSDDAGVSLLGFNRENVGGFPIEVVPFSVSGDSVYSNIVVARASGPDVPVTFKYILFRGGSLFEMLEYGGGSSTIVGHPNAAGAISVGAVRYDKNPIYSPGTYAAPVIMSFSSVGGTPVDGVVRSKPDISAPNGVNTTVDLGNGDWDNLVDPDTNYPNFFGTSAASPHAAGMAALLIEANEKFEPGSVLDPEGIRTIMKSTAIDMDDPGDDYVSGSGFVQAHKAVMTFANPTPYVENLILASEGGIPGQEITPFSFTVTGDFFTDSTQVLFRGEPLETGVVVEDEHTITVEHPGFIGFPEIQTYNPVVSSSGLDGGVSEGIFFSDPIRQTVVISASKATKKYGELNPVYTADILVVTVEGDSLELADAVSGGLVLQVEADRLSGLSYTVAANASSDAGEYLLEPYLSPELDMGNPLTEIDFAISEKYILEFVNGSLNIEKLALTITPVDVDMVYGEALPAGGFDFLYEIADSSATIEDLGLVLNGVEQEHSAALTNEISLIRGVALVNGIPILRGTALVNGVKMLRGTALVNGVEVKVEVEGSDTTVFVAGEAIVNGITLVRGIALVNGLPFVSMTQIVRGIALVNGDEITFDDGYMTELNGIALVNKIPAIRGTALVNGINSRALALVNGQEVVVENGITTIDGLAVPTNGIALVNGIPIVRGTALVNSINISRGMALVNGLEVPIENGIPSARGIALVNAISGRGIALVNGIPMLRGTALVNNLEVEVEDGEVSRVFENGVLLNGFSMSRGVALVNGIALVNGVQLSRGVALVNGIALVNEAGTGDDVVNLENMNLIASGTALVNGSIPSVRGIALVNGIEGVDGEALKIATGTMLPDSTIIYEDVSVINGIALVNGLSYVRGTALVNGSFPTKGTALVNGSSIDENDNSGAILVFDATDIGAEAEDVSFTPMSFITGTTAGQHWIVPGTFLSNNFEISYGLGKLNIDQADLAIRAEDKNKVYGEADPDLTYTESGLFPGDLISGELAREEGEGTGDYNILQGSVAAGDDYSIVFDTATFTIDPAALTVGVIAGDKVYDGSREAVVMFSDNRLSEDSLTISYTSALFADKHVGTGKEVTVLGISVTGADADNYLANTEAVDTATITQKGLEIGISAMDKIYDGNTFAATAAFVLSGKVEGDTLMLLSANGMFDSKNVGIGKRVTTDVSTTGADAGNYLANSTADTTATISATTLVIGITADDKIYDGSEIATTTAFVESGLVDGDDVEVSASGGLFDSKHVGTGKMVSADVSTAGADAANYLTNSTADTIATISGRELVIGITADDKVYDGTQTATTAAFVESGLVEGDDVEASATGGLFDSKQVGAGKMVSADVSTAGADGGNYLANLRANTTATITATALVIGITADDRTYDGTQTATTTAFVESGLVEGDDVEVLSSGGLFDSKHVGTSKMVSADVSATGADAGNYLANSTADTIATISGRELVIGITGDDKIYDGTQTATTAAFVESGLLIGDMVEVLSSGGLFDNKDVGTGKMVTADVSATGADAGNYSFYTTAEAYAAIVQKEVVVTPLKRYLYIYEGDPLPSGAFNYEGWIAGDEGNESYTALRYYTWKPYDPNSDRSSGYYILTPTPSNSNYSFDVKKGWLYVINNHHHQNSHYKSASVSTNIAEEESLDPDQILVYPNPVIDMVQLVMKDIENYKLLVLYDYAGRSYPLYSIEKGDDKLKINMDRIPSGHYIIRIVMEDDMKVVPIIKQ